MADETTPLDLTTRCASCAGPDGRCTGYRGEFHTYRCTCPCHHVAAGRPVAEDTVERDPRWGMPRIRLKHPGGNTITGTSLDFDPIEKWFAAGWQIDAEDLPSMDEWLSEEDAS